MKTTRKIKCAILSCLIIPGLAAISTPAQARKCSTTVRSHTRHIPHVGTVKVKQHVRHYNKHSFGSPATNQETKPKIEPVNCKKPTPKDDKDNKETIKESKVNIDKK